jgi:UDPglucose 6-dehydrogenase
MISTVSVVGLGRVGLCFATFLADRGIRVKGVENDPRRKQAILSGSVLSNEKGLNDLLAGCRDSLDIVELREAAAATDLSFLIVPTLTRPDGSLSDHILTQVVVDIAAATRGSDRHHTIVVVSTVSPGSIKQLSRRLEPQDKISICYSPIFVAQGSIVKDLEDPPFVLIGAEEPETHRLLGEFYQRVRYNESLLVRTTILNAEIAKLTLNAFLANKIAFANSVAAVCDRIPGAHAGEVLGILARDPRIGSACLKAGTPFGGPCLPRDNNAFRHFVLSNGANPAVVTAVGEFNDYWYRYLLDKVTAHAPRSGAIIGILGLTYKPWTDYFGEGFGISLARDLIRRGFRVIAYDPSLEEVGAVTVGIEMCNDLEDLTRRSDLYVLTWSDEALANKLAQLDGQKPVIALWKKN